MWFPTQNTNKTKHLLKFGCLKLGTVVQFLTGFCNLMRHKHLKHDWISPMCRLCYAEEETPMHLAAACPALITARMENFQVHMEEELVSWSPDRLYRFISETSICELLEEDIDYTT